LSTSSIELSLGRAIPCLGHEEGGAAVLDLIRAELRERHCFRSRSGSILLVADVLTTVSKLSSILIRFDDRVNVG
jgi:hypothetical protein